MQHSTRSLQVSKIPCFLQAVSVCDTSDIRILAELISHKMAFLYSLVILSGEFSSSGEDFFCQGTSDLTRCGIIQGNYSQLEQKSDILGKHH